MSHDPIPQHILAELAAAWAMLQRCRRPNSSASITLRLSMDRVGVGRLEGQNFEGLTWQAVARSRPEGSKA